MDSKERRRPWTFYYDGECGFCTASVSLLARADLLGKVRWTDFRGLPELPAGLTREQLDKAAYLQIGIAPAFPAPQEEREIRLFEGFYAFRMLTLRLPPLFPLIPLLWTPGINRLGEAAYSWVARNRYRISRRCRLKANK